MKDANGWKYQLEVSRIFQFLIKIIIYLCISIWYLYVDKTFQKNNPSLSYDLIKISIEYLFQFRIGEHFEMLFCNVKKEERKKKVA